MAASTSSKLTSTELEAARPRYAGAGTESAAGLEAPRLRNAGGAGGTANVDGAVKVSGSTDDEDPPPATVDVAGWSSGATHRDWLTSSSDMRLAASIRSIRLRRSARTSKT